MNLSSCFVNLFVQTHKHGNTFVESINLRISSRYAHFANFWIFKFSINAWTLQSSDDTRWHKSFSWINFLKIIRDIGLLENIQTNCHERRRRHDVIKFYDISDIPDLESRCHATVLTRRSTSAIHFFARRRRSLFGWRKKVFPCASLPFLLWPLFLGWYKSLRTE